MIMWYREIYNQIKYRIKTKAMDITILLLFIIIILSGMGFASETKKNKSEKKPVLVGIQYFKIDKFDYKDNFSGYGFKGFSKEEVLNNTANQISVVEGENRSALFPNSDFSDDKSHKKIIFITFFDIENGLKTIFKILVSKGYLNWNYPYIQLITIKKSDVFYFFESNGERSQDIILKIKAVKSNEVKIDKIDTGKFLYYSTMPYIGIMDIIDEQDGFVMLLSDYWQKMNMKNRSLKRIELNKNTIVHDTIGPFGVTGGVLLDKSRFVIIGSENSESGKNVIDIVNIQTGKVTVINNLRTGYSPILPSRGEPYTLTRVPLELSPDKRYLAFTARYNEKGKETINHYEKKVWLSIFELKCGSIRKIAPIGTDYKNLLAWNPVKPEIIAQVCDEKKGNLQLVNVKTGEVKRIAAAGGTTTKNYKIKWSPDGQKIAYLNHKRQIMVYDMKSDKTVKMDDRQYLDFFWVK